MSIQDLGSIGELVAAIATVVTLVYLAAQVRHNTRALKASTFQSISAEMGQNVLPMMMSPEMPDIYHRLQTDPDSLTPAERIRVQAMLLTSVRRLEATFVHAELGSISKEFVEGFELSILSILNTTAFARQWWTSAKAMFYKPFVAHVDAALAHEGLPNQNPAFIADT